MPFLIESSDCERKKSRQKGYEKTKSLKIHHIFEVRVPVFEFSYPVFVPTAYPFSI